MSTTARGAESMFLDVKELAVHKLNIRKRYAPGNIDYHTADLKQIEPLEVVATAELIESQIRVSGQLDTKIELQCERCLATVRVDLNLRFNLLSSPLHKLKNMEEVRLQDLDADNGFYKGDGQFLTDVLVEQVLLAVQMKDNYRSDCRGL